MPGRDSGAGARRGSAKRATEPSLSGTAGIRLAARSRDLEVAGELPAHRDALDAHVVRQPVAVRRIGLTGDQRLEVAAAGLGDAEAIRADVPGGELFLLVGDLRERHLPHHPFVEI